MKTIGLFSLFDQFCLTTKGVFGWCPSTGFGVAVGKRDLVVMYPALVGSQGWAEGGDRASLCVLAGLLVHVDEILQRLELLMMTWANKPSGEWARKGGKEELFVLTHRRQTNAF
uniref:Uncharacterized protein n=1 Tax=Moniliophthora roreri TaxID=221103 RepID=A0A0W0FHK5_MONRR